MLIEAELITWRRHLCPCLQLLAEPRGTRTLWPWSAMGLTHLVRLALTMLQLATQLATVGESEWDADLTR